VLDAGGGSGELAVRLVRHGYQVWLVDSAKSMLEQARQLAQSLAEEERARLTFCLMPVDEVAGAFSAASFDAITCHTLIEYLPHPRDSLGRLVGLLRPGGVLSLSFVNHHAEVLRQVWGQGDSIGQAGAMARLDPAAAGAFRAKLFNLPGRAYTAGEVSAWLVELGLSVTAHLGVRAFADQIRQQHGTDRLNDPDFFQALLHLELAAASRSPYKLIARYAHLIAHQAEETGDS
jgi:S-adenosylmethionine-dependent methyltransferase